MSKVARQKLNCNLLDFHIFVYCLCKSKNIGRRIISSLLLVVRGKLRKSFIHSRPRIVLFGSISWFRSAGSTKAFACFSISALVKRRTDIVRTRPILKMFLLQAIVSTEKNNFLNVSIIKKKLTCA